MRDVSQRALRELVAHAALQARPALGVLGVSGRLAGGAGGGVVGGVVGVEPRHGRTGGGGRWNNGLSQKKGTLEKKIRRKEGRKACHARSERDAWGMIDN